jgi:ubiquinol-cytochrome c reductase core subunit 2
MFNSSYAPFEFMQAKELVELETHAALADSRSEVFEALHALAFRKGLGHSLYAKESDIAQLSRADLSEFAARTFAGNRVAIVGTGVSANDLAECVAKGLENVSVASKGLGYNPSFYYGGETRLDKGPSSEAHFVVAYPSVSWASPNYTASLVLEAVLDGQQRVMHGSLSGSACLLSSASTESTSVHSFGVHHSDAGLLGFYIQGKDTDVNSVASKAISALKSIAAKGIDDATLSRAKKSTIVDFESNLCRKNSLLWAAKQVLTMKSIRSVKDWADSIQKVTGSQVQKVCI